MSATAEKARALRLQRLNAMLEKRLENPSAALEVLVSELLVGEPQTALWEALHAAAARDGVEKELATAYGKITSERRLQQLEPNAQADVLVHAADFYQGILGDGASAEKFLERVHHVVPGHREAFIRLERRFEAASDRRRVVELYALVAAAKPPDMSELATKAVNRIVPLPASTPLADEVCQRLVALVPSNPGLLDVLEAHCRKTKRPALACALIEQALSDPNLPRSAATKQRRRLVELYVAETTTPEAAIGHVEELLEQDAADEVARDGAEKLLSNRQVAARAAAALQKARRRLRGTEGPPGAGPSKRPPGG